MQVNEPIKKILNPIPLKSHGLDEAEAFLSI